MKIRPEWRIEFQAMKEICARNGISMNEEFYKRAVRMFLREHNWPPGNSQTQIAVFSEVNLVRRGCDHPNCDKDAVYIDYAKPPGEHHVYSCQEHHDKAVENRLLKNYRSIGK